MIQSAPYGSWKSPITAAEVAAGSIQFSEVRLSQGKVFWLERRPLEKGRTALMSWNELEGEKELLPKEYNLRTRVHEYGGGALLIDGSRIFFVNDEDQQIYRFEKGKIDRITNKEKTRFADGCAHGFFLYYIAEEHQERPLNSTINSLVRINLTDRSIHTVASGADFYSSPRISPDGRFLAYISWNLPNMPWDGTELWVLDLKTGEKKKITGGLNESIADPSWSPSSKLHYVSDKSGWWNLYVQGESDSLYPTKGEFCLPQWIFGRTLYGFDKEAKKNQIVCSYVVDGFSTFAAILPNRTHQRIAMPYTSTTYLSVEGGKMALIASSPEEPYSIILYDLKENSEKIIKRSRSTYPPGFLSKPKAISFSSANGRVIHAFYYPPTNPHYQSLKEKKPPLLVHSHGGPTSADPPCFASNALYWTSRGFAYITVNYGGSTGYGRAYRDSLKRMWGIVDIEDCTQAAVYCVSQGLADPKRLAIEGGSSGGYTTLEALCQSNTFQVGADHFGVSDLEGLALDTHKFESRYLDQLIGPYPEEKALYHERSPIDHAERIKSPVIIFQGDEDAIVPPSQSEKIYQSLLSRNISTAYLLFQGEQHGFRKAENIQLTYEAQLYFFSKILGFPLGESLPSIEIENF